jgi:hypothetical protein
LVVDVDPLKRLAWISSSMHILTKIHSVASTRCWRAGLVPNLIGWDNTRYQAVLGWWFPLCRGGGVAAVTTSIASIAVVVFILRVVDIFCIFQKESRHIGQYTTLTVTDGTAEATSTSRTARNTKTTLTAFRFRLRQQMGLKKSGVVVLYPKAQTRIRTVRESLYHMINCKDQETELEEKDRCAEDILYYHGDGGLCGMPFVVSIVMVSRIRREMSERVRVFDI